MKLCEIPMVTISLLGFSLWAGLDVTAARADFTFGEPVDIKPAFPLLSLTGDFLNSFSTDDLEVYFDSNRSGSHTMWDLWVCKRVSPEDDWGLPENLGPAINSGSFNWASSISGDGLELYFTSMRPGGYGQNDVYVTTRVTRDSPWGPPSNLGVNVNGSSQDGCQWVSADGLELFFQSDRSGGYGGTDIYVSKRATTQDPWGPASNLGPAVNSPFNESNPRLSPDGLLLVFDDSSAPRPGGYGGWDLWMTRRADRSAPWEPPVNLGSLVNTSIMDICRAGCFVPDGSGLYFGRADDAGVTSAAWLKAPILPVVDFNADGAVDLADLVLLIDNWGTDDTLYDIGPYAWGDGVMDVEDLKAFIAEWERESVPAQP